MIGVLGSVGPAATLDLMTKFHQLTPTAKDQEHLLPVVMSDPRILDRPAPILDGEGPSPAPGHGPRR